MFGLNDIRNLAEYVSDQNGLTRGEISATTSAYLESPFVQREKAFRELTDNQVRALNQGIVIFCEFAIGEVSLAPLWTALLCMEQSAGKRDWRENLVNLLILDHTLETLKAENIRIDKEEWRRKSPGTLNNFMQLDERSPALRNIESVELVLKRYADHVKFEAIKIDSDPSKSSSPFWN